MIPNLIHPVPIVVRKRVQGTTLMDTVTKEPIGKVERGPEITLDGQVSWKDEEILSSIGGKNLKSEGYILFRRVDLAAKGITIEEGDEIVRIGTGDGTVQAAYYVVRIQKRAHYPDQGGFTLVKAWYSDMDPVRIT